MHNGFAQAEGVDNLAASPPRAASSLRLPEVQGRPRRLRPLRRDLPAGDRQGVRITRGDAPLREFRSPLHWDTALGYRVR